MPIAVERKNRQLSMHFIHRMENTPSLWNLCDAKLHYLVRIHLTDISSLELDAALCGVEQA